VLNPRYSSLDGAPLEKTSDEASADFRHSSTTMPYRLGYCAAPPLYILVGCAAAGHACPDVWRLPPTRVALSGILK